MAKLSPSILPKDKEFLKLLRARPHHHLLHLDFCYKEGTELLTKRGWVDVCSINNSDVVWQVDKDTLEGSWATPSRIISYEYNGEMYNFTNKRGSLHVTSNHTMLWIGQRNHKRADKARFRLVTKSQDKIPRQGLAIATSTSSNNIGDVSITDKDIWMACMIQADGSLYNKQYPTPKYTVQVAVPKKRAKAAELLGRRGSIYTREGKMEVEAWHSIPTDLPLLTKNKGLDLTTLPSDKAEVFVAALSFWDSYTHLSGNRFSYASTDEATIDEVQRYLVINGYEAKKSVNKPGNDRHKPCYQLSIKKHGDIRTRPEDVYSYIYNGMVGCVTVPSGFLLVRSEGQTFVSGNCALEPTITAEMSRDPMYMEIYSSGKPHDIYLFFAIKAGDPQAAAINAVYNVDNPTESSVSAAKKQFKSVRDKWKTNVLLSTYGGGSEKKRKKAMSSGMWWTKEEAKSMHNNYMAALSGLEEFSESIKQEWITNGGYFLNPLGRPVACAASKVKDLMNRSIQSGGHDCNLLFIGHINRLRKERGIRMYPWNVDLHDATIWEAHKDDVEAAKKAMEDSLVWLNEYLGGTIPLKGDVDIGESFYDFKKD